MRESMNFVETPQPHIAPCAIGQKIVLRAIDPKLSALDESAFGQEAAVQELSLLTADFGKDETPWPVLALGGDKKEEEEAEEKEDDEDDDDLDEDDDDDLDDDDDDDFDDDDEEDEDEDDDDEDEEEEDEDED